MQAQNDSPTAARFEMTDSSVIGRNFTVPSGTPRAGHGPEGELQLVLEAAVFFEELPRDGRNDDFGAKIPELEGQTFLGFLAPLRLRYRASEQFTMEAGATLAQNFGDDDTLDGTEPIVRLILEPWENFFAIAGTIYPTHPMHNALLWQVHPYQDATEEGVQFRVDRECWRNDLWLDWQIREGSDNREVFDVGNVTELDFGPVRLEGEMLWYHAGGQRNSVDGVENSIATALGLSCGFPLDDDREREEIRVGLKGFHVDEDGDQDDFTGHGVEVRCEATLWSDDPHVGVRPYVSYFNGDDFHTRRGDPLYQLDNLTQVGVQLSIPFAGGGLVRFEAAGQHGEGELDYLVGFTVSFGESFLVPVSRVQPTMAAAVR